MLALRELLFTLHLYSGLWPSVRGKVTSDNLNLRNLRHNKKYLHVIHVILTLIKSESAHPITPVEWLKPRFWESSEICSLLAVNNNKYSPHFVDNLIFRINVPDYPSRTVESDSLRLFWNFCIFCLLYIHINNNKFTYDKFKTVKFGFSILNMFYLSFIKIVYFLVNTADKEIYNIYQ